MTRVGGSRPTGARGEARGERRAHHPPLKDPNDCQRGRASRPQRGNRNALPFPSGAGSSSPATTDNEQDKGTRDDHDQARAPPYDDRPAERRDAVSQKDWIEKDYYKALGVSEDREPGGHQEGVPRPRQEAPPGLERERPEVRGEVQGGLRGLRRPLGRGQAQGVRRGAHAVRQRRLPASGRLRRAAGCRRRGVVRPQRPVLAHEQRRRRGCRRFRRRWRLQRRVRRDLQPRWWWRRCAARVARAAVPTSRAR